VNPRPLDAVHAGIERYYSAKVLRHGATPAGVDWTCAPTQQLRFVQLLRVCDFSTPCSLNDLGCGWGALLGFLGTRHKGAKVDYLGIDLSQAMVEQARARYRSRRAARFVVGAASDRVADYSLASGLFNVRIDQPLPAWEHFIEETLRGLAATSTRGFAVNFLAPLPDGMEGKPELYRTPAAPWVQFIEEEAGWQVRVLAAYGMREFTLLASR
jgi:SAM-dependent methyltransferase